LNSRSPVPQVGLQPQLLDINREMFCNIPRNSPNVPGVCKTPHLKAVVPMRLRHLYRRSARASPPRPRSTIRQLSMSAPGAKRSSSLSCDTRCAICGIMHCSKIRVYSPTLSAPRRSNRRIAATIAGAIPPIPMTWQSQAQRSASPIWHSGPRNVANTSIPASELNGSADSMDHGRRPWILPQGHFLLSLSPPTTSKSDRAEVLPRIAQLLQVTLPLGL
jgi:hypothetical protein